MLLKSVIRTLFTAFLVYAIFVAGLSITSSTVSMLTANSAVRQTPTSQSLNKAVTTALPSVVTIKTTKPVDRDEISEPELSIVETPFGTFEISMPGIIRPDVNYIAVGTGSGVIISPDGYILTNKHVVSDNESTLTVTLYNGEEREAKVVYRDPKLDAAIIKIDGDVPAYAKLGDSSKLKRGDQIIAVGNMLGQKRNSVSSGVIAAFNRNIIATGDGQPEELRGLIQTTAPITEGYSGGPLVDAQGKVVGINVAKSVHNDYASFTIPINTIKPRIAQYM